MEDGGVGYDDVASDPFDAWGDEPSWAQEPGTNADSSGDINNNGGQPGEGGRFGGFLGAQHILLLIDCSPPMFEPCIVQERIHDESGDELNGQNQDAPLEDEEESADRLRNKKKQRIQRRNQPIRGRGSSPALSTNLISPFDAALMAAEQLLRQRVNHVSTSRTGKRDGVGVMLFGLPPRRSGIRCFDDEEDDDYGFGAVGTASTTHMLIPITPPGVNQVKSIQECLPQAEAIFQFGQRNSDNDESSPSPLFSPSSVGTQQLGGNYPHLQSQLQTSLVNGRSQYPRTRDLQNEFGCVRSEDNVAGPSEMALRMGHNTLCPLRSALHEAGKAFRDAKCVKRNGTSATTNLTVDMKSVWIFTNEDDPCNGNEEEKRQVVIVARDAVDNGLDINVWPLPTAVTSRVTTNTSVQCGFRGQRHGFFDRGLFYDYVTTRDGMTDRSSDLALEGLPRSRREINSAHEDVKQPTVQDDIPNLEEFLSLAGRQWKKVRRVLQVPLLLPMSSDIGAGDEDATFGGNIVLDFYRLVKTQQKPLPVHVHQVSHNLDEKTNAVKAQTRLCVRTTQTVAIDTGEIVQKKHMRTHVDFGSERVYITPDEMSEIKRQSHAVNVITPNLLLLGFKPMSSSMLLNARYALDRPYFAYPNDEKGPVSRAAFSALHTVMIQKDVWGVGELVVSTRAVARLVAIVPQAEERVALVDEEAEDGEDGNDDEEYETAARATPSLSAAEVAQATAVPSEQVRPPGWIILPLPYEDDVRSLPPSIGTDCLWPFSTGRVLSSSTPFPFPDDDSKGGLTSKSVDNDPARTMVEAAKQVILHQQMMGIEWGTNFANPALTKFWKYVESIALGNPAAPLVPGSGAGNDSMDDTDETKMDVEGILHSAGKQINAFRNMLPSAEDDEAWLMDKRTKKKMKNGNVEWNQTGENASKDIDWRAMYELEKLSEFTAEKMRDFLRSIGLKVSGRKADLISRITKHFEENTKKDHKKKSNANSLLEGTTTKATKPKCNELKVRSQYSDSP